MSSPQPRCDYCTARTEKDEPPGQWTGCNLMRDRHQAQTTKSIILYDVDGRPRSVFPHESNVAFGIVLPASRKGWRWSEELAPKCHYYRLSATLYMLWLAATTNTTGTGP